MRLQEAIEIAETEVRCLTFKGGSKRPTAFRLLIEAAKRLQLHREHSIPGPMFLLPGETKD